MNHPATVAPRAIKPIETHYKGYRFRSRLEARWAVFFESLGLNWEYEKEGFVLPSGKRYLPDFYVSGIGFFEIKPLPDDFEGGMVCPPEDSPEGEFFCRENDPPIEGGILYGTPGVVEGLEYDPACPYVGAIVYDGPYFFCECPDCGVIGFQFDGRSARVKHKTGCPVMPPWDDKNYNTNSPRLAKAVEKARSARFEHGEQP